MKFTKSTLEEIKNQAIEDFKQAESILEGEADNYDGCDGARYALDWTTTIQELCKFILSGEKIEI